MGCRSSAAQAQISAMIQPITVQPNRRFTIKIPAKSRFLWPKIEGRKYNSVTESRNIMAPPLCTTIYVANLFHRSCYSPSYETLHPALVFAAHSGGLRLRHFRQELRESLLAVFLIEPLVDFGDLRGVHRTEFRAAHGTELRFLVKIVRQSFVVHRAGGFGIERKLELLVPVEQKTRVAERVVAIARAGTMPRHIRRVRCNLVRNHALANVVRIRQAEMLFRRDVAEHRSSVPADHRGADRAGNVVVTWRDVRDERAERIERRFVAQLVLFLHLHLDLIERNMSRTFDHHLHIIFPSFFREFAENAQLGKLCFVARIREAAGTQPVAER